MHTLMAVLTWLLKQLKINECPIDHYATIDMDGLHDMIDTLGGVDVVSNSTFTMGANHFVKGKNTRRWRCCHGLY